MNSQGFFQDYEDLNQVSRQSTEWLLRCFRLDQSGGSADWQTDMSTTGAANKKLIVVSFAG